MLVYCRVFRTQRFSSTATMPCPATAAHAAPHSSSWYLHALKMSKIKNDGSSGKSIEGMNWLWIIHFCLGYPSKQHVHRGVQKIAGFLQQIDANDTVYFARGLKPRYWDRTCAICTLPPQCSSSSTWVGILNAPVHQSIRVKRNDIHAYQIWQHHHQPAHPWYKHSIAVTWKFILLQTNMELINKRRFLEDDVPIAFLAMFGFRFMFLFRVP